VLFCVLLSSRDGSVFLTLGQEFTLQQVDETPPLLGIIPNIYTHTQRHINMPRALHRLKTHTHTHTHTQMIVSVTYLHHHRYWSSASYVD
jgi:hypothetical protein